ncbi:MAG: SusC/RagA family TonB-linked outer membrane protein [Chitinophagaceae bacterium]|nr:SusC/RagA family TonB-linked outer membrane protein [Chitinophagaceae bacterium]
MRKVFSFLAGLVLIVGTTQAQNRTISGKVTDEKGGGVAGVSVTVKGSTIGTTSGTDGSYSLSVPTTAKVLVFTSVNFSTEEKNIGTVNSISVSLKSKDQNLAEVVVVGYGTQKRKEITGSIANVSGADIANKPVQSFEQSLGGRAAGVQITIPNGVLNAAPVIRIRGTNSISLSSYPLIVIDGIPAFTGDVSATNAAANPLASINPNDIESIDIAKDAAATAIYGSRASNGVVFVTTKKGKSGKAKVAYSGSFGWSNVQRLPKLLDAFQYTEFKNKALVNANSFNAATNSFYLTNDANGNPINTNWYDHVYRQGIQTDHSVSVSGANDATKYYFSAGYTKQSGIIRTNDFIRTNILMNIDHKANKHIAIGGKIQYSNQQNNAAVSAGSLGDAFATAGLGRVPLITAPNVAPKNNDGSYNLNGQLIGVMGNKVGQVGFFNPVPSLELNRGNSETNQFQGNVYIEAKPINGLTLKTIYGVDYIFTDNDSYFNPITGEGFASNGSVTSTFSKNKRWVWTNTAQFDKTINKHEFSLLIGNEHQKSDGVGFGLNRITVNDPAFTNIQGGWSTPNTAGLTIGENYLYSEFSRVQYNFNKKYFVTANLRRDGASQLGVNSKFGTFWGVSAGWNISDEAFYTRAKLDKIFSSLRLKSSYGKVGNIGGLGNFASLSTFGSGLYGGNGTTVFQSSGNSNLTWETSKKTDIGINWGILNDKITGELTFYKNNIDGLLLFVPAPPSAGLPSTLPQNSGSMYNQGVEFSLSSTPISNKNFSWTTSFNIAYNKNEVTSLAPGLTQIVSSTGGLENPSITRPGLPIGMLFVTQTKGVDQATGRRIFVNAAGRDVYFQHVAPSGQNRFSYSDGSLAPQVSSADAKPLYNTNPKYVGGF